ncbi:hypothetical protein MMC17_008902 [Xylographa soralifera]|nr:hypothetical protein [Xylographa soralifera]
MNQFPVTNTGFGPASSNSIANRRQQDLENYDYSFLGFDSSAQIGNGIDLDPMPPLNVGFGRVSPQLTGQEANFDYRDYMASNNLRSAILDDNQISHSNAIYDSPGQPSACKEPEEPTQAGSHSGHRHDEDNLRNRILDLEDKRRQAWLTVENIDSKLTTLRKANDILRS